MDAFDVQAWKRVETETVVLGGEKARQFAEKHCNLPHSPTERPLAKKRVEMLQQRIAQGAAIPFFWAVVSFEGATYRMNGQHSSHAIHEFPGHVPEDLAFHCDKYAAKNAEGMGHLFRQFDARWSSRSKGDVAGAYQGLMKEIAACDRKHAKFAIEGVIWHRREIDHLPTGSGDDAYILLLNPVYSPFIKWIDEILAKKATELRYQGVIAAMYACFLKSESASRDFWLTVAMNNLSDASEPAALLSHELQESDEAKDAKDRLRVGELYGKSIVAWNAFRDKQKLPALRVNPKKALPEAK